MHGKDPFRTDAKGSDMIVHQQRAPTVLIRDQVVLIRDRRDPLAQDRDRDRVPTNEI